MMLVTNSESITKHEKERIEVGTSILGSGFKHSLYSVIVGEESTKQRILAAMADPYSRKILAATMREAVGALTLAKACEIPVTTVYRRIEELVQAGLVASVRASRTKDGKWYDLYLSTVKRIDVSSENGTLMVGLAKNEKVPEKFTRTLTATNL